MEKVSDCVELRSLICSDETSRTLHPNHFLLIGTKEKMIMGLKLELRRMRNGGREKEKARSEARVCLEEQGRHSIHDVANNGVRGCVNGQIHITIDQGSRRYY